MRTTKPISTISFNSVTYLRQKLEELTKAGVLSFWCFIQHEPEDDEGGKKKHIHLYAEPAKMMQTDELKNELKEYDPEHPDKPLSCISWVHSKFEHWYLYAIHDADYLQSKQQARKYHYKHEMIVSSDEDDLLYKAKTIDLLSVSPFASIVEAQRQGLSWNEFFNRGLIPIPQINQFRDAWYTILGKGSEFDNLKRGKGRQHPFLNDDNEIVNPGENDE